MGTVLEMGICEQCSKDIEDEESSVAPITNEEGEVVISSRICPKEIYFENNPVEEPPTDKLTDQSNVGQKVIFNIFEHYVQIRHLEDDSFGSIYIIKNKLTEQLRALREIPKYSVLSEKEKISQKLITLNKLDHPNITKLIEYHEDDNNYYLIKEKCDEYFLSRNPKVKINCCEFVVKYIMYQIFFAINFLHEHDIVHGQFSHKCIGFIYIGNIKNKDKNKQDEEIEPIERVFDYINKNKNIQEELLTTENIDDLSKDSLDAIKRLSKYQLKLIDCGVAGAFFQKENKPSLNAEKENLNYYSPEYLIGHSGRERDEWACGIVMYFLISGHFPFDGNTENEILQKIQIIPLNIETEEFKDISFNCKSLISKLLCKTCTGRINVSKALKSDFFKNGIKISDIWSNSLDN